VNVGINSLVSRVILSADHPLLSAACLDAFKQSKTSTTQNNIIILDLNIAYRSIIYEYKWPTNALQNLWYILITMFSQTCFGQYSGHLQGDVLITRIQNVQMWLVMSPHLYVFYSRNNNITLKMAGILAETCL
jgi:hypothetical protein